MRMGNCNSQETILEKETRRTKYRAVDVRNTSHLCRHVIKLGLDWLGSTSLTGNWTCR